MSWMTRAELRRDDAASAALVSLLRDAGGRDMGHRLVWTLFSDDPDAARGFLYREAEVGSYLIVSDRPPVDPKGLWSLQSKPYAPDLRAGMRLGFALRANPTRWVKTSERPQGTRVDVVMHAKKASLAASEKVVWGPDAIERVALGWLFEREARLGIRFDRALCAAGGYRQVVIARGDERPIRFSVIDYEGVFDVVEPEPLLDAARNGLGRAKAHGCGLLLIRPANR